MEILFSPDAQDILAAFDNRMNDLLFGNALKEPARSALNRAHRSALCRAAEYAIHVARLNQAEPYVTVKMAVQAVTDETSQLNAILIALGDYCEH